MSCLTVMDKVDQICSNLPLPGLNPSPPLWSSTTVLAGVWHFGVSDPHFHVLSTESAPATVLFWESLLLTSDLSLWNHGVFPAKNNSSPQGRDEGTVTGEGPSPTP